MTNKIDRTLINRLTVLAGREKKLKEFKRRARLKGKIIKIGETKNKNLRLTVKKGDEKLNFVVMKSHKEKYELAKTLAKNDNISIEGKRVFRAYICTRLWIKRTDKSQKTLNSFE